MISVFTPSHNTRYLNDCYQSLYGQTLSDWEWIVLLNRGASNWSPPAVDERVKVIREAKARGVGAAKRAACEAASGDVLVELDHDDLLVPTCLARVRAAFAEHPDVSLVYSNTAQVNRDLSRNEDLFNLAMGWRYSDVEVGGKSYVQCHAMAPYPHNVAYIWYAPNHVRAYRKSSYDAVGGYDASLEVLDDHELMIRLFMEGEFRHIDKCLYLQRIHPRNTQSEPRTNAFIQEQTVRYYQEHIAALATTWSHRNGLVGVSLCTETSPDLDDVAVDTTVMIDGDNPQLPFDESSVGLIRAPELLQRVRNRARLFNECYRVLAHGGLILTNTPSTDGRGAFQDPSHVAFYNENSFWYLTQPRLRRSIPDLNARFQISHVRTYFPSEWEQEVGIAYVEANLLAVKDGPRLGGPLHD